MRNWSQTCHQALQHELRQILARAQDKGRAPESDQAPDSALARLVELLKLTPFERALLVLAAGVELDGGFARAITEQSGGSPQPTVGMAFALLEGGHMDALHPDGPLRAHDLIQLDGDGALTQRRLRLDERVLFHLMGLGGLDPMLRGWTRSVPAQSALLPGQRTAGEWLTRVWDAHATGRPPVPQLLTPSASEARAVIGWAAAQFELRAVEISAELLTTTSPTRVARVCDREHMLTPSLFLIRGECEPRAVERFCEAVRVFVILTGPSARSTGERISPQLRLEPLGTDERITVMRRVLPENSDVDEGDLRAVAQQFHVSTRELMDACSAFAASAGSSRERLWDACRQRARPEVGALAQRIDGTHGWDDLVLPPHAREQLEELLRYARTRDAVMERGGFAAKGTRGLGLAALFAGPSGTGKTLAAEVIANTLALDLYRVDLSSVVSKYIGETETNLSRIFDAAESGGFVLLFDEADALFGKRGEVKDSHDRYANIEVSDLLQRMEAYRGLAILTTNLRDHLDPAFLRRLQVIVEFPFPNQAARRALWARAFPAQTATEALDLDRLAQFNVTGGHIRNIALDAAVRAADQHRPVDMTHLLAAARREYRKMQRALSPAELRGWR